MEFAKWFETADRDVKKTDIPVRAFLVYLGRLLKIKRFEPIQVSTVFLGLNHNFGNGPPMLFETMIFGGRFDQEQWRYSTWEEAEKGHQAALDYIARKGKDLNEQ
jgi:hypothetical protein